jgi:hypothetical protein
MEVGIITLAFEESGRTNAESAEELPSGIMTSIDSALAKYSRTILSEFPTKSASFLWCTQFGVFFVGESMLAKIQLNRLKVIVVVVDN